MTGGTLYTAESGITAAAAGSAFKGSQNVTTVVNGNETTVSVPVLSWEETGPVELQITVQPVSASAVDSNKVTMSVTAIGEGDLTYQWYYKAAGSNKWKKTSVKGNKTSEITFVSTEARNGNQYCCDVTDSEGNTVTSDAAEFTYVAKPLAITAQPQDTSVKENKTATMTVAAESTVAGDLTYQWYYKAAGSNVWKKTSVKGNKTATISMTAKQIRADYSYRCVITDAEGNTVTSDAAQLTVISAN